MRAVGQLLSDATLEVTAVAVDDDDVNRFHSNEKNLDTVWSSNRKIN